MVTTPKPDLASLRIQDTKRTSPGSGKRWVWIVLAVIVLVLIAAAASAFLNRKTEVQVANSSKPATGPAGVLNASGYITPRRRATIAAKITGRVTGVFFDEGKEFFGLAIDPGVPYSFAQGKRIGHWDDR